MSFSLSNSVCLLAVNGVVIACDKKVNSTLIDTSDFQKIQNITPATGLLRIIIFTVTF